MKFWRQRKDEELDAEIRSHLDEAIRDHIARGEAPDEARANALREFGNVGLVKEVTREMWGWASLERLMQDLRFGLRMLRKNPGFSLIAMLTLALGIGANTAIFSVVNAVLVRPLPFGAPESLVYLWNTNPALGAREGHFMGGEVWAVRKQATSCAAVSAWMPMTAIVTGKQPERMVGGSVELNFFQTLGVQPLLGRVFTKKDDEEDDVVLIGYDLWQRQFGGDPNVIGQKVNIENFDGGKKLLLGVMPPGFAFPPRAEVWTPLEIGESAGTGNRFLRAIARLKPGVTATQAHAELTAIAQATAAQTGHISTGWEVTPMPLREFLFGSVDTALPLLFGAVACVLLIACTNVANLQLARAAARQKEIAVRRAVGAGRGRIVRQLLTESLLLALAGGALGLLLARGLLSVLRVLGPSSLSQLQAVTLDARALWFTLGLALVTGVLFGLAPAWQSSNPDLQHTLKDSGQLATTSVRGRRLRQSLIVAQVAIAAVLLIGAGLLIKSFWQVRQVSLGVTTEQVLLTSISPSWEEYTPQPFRKDNEPTKWRLTNFYQQVLARIEKLPGVVSVGATSQLLLDGREVDMVFEIKGRPNRNAEKDQHAELRVITPDYFTALRIPLHRGRPLTEHDTSTTPLSVLVNETFARRYFPGRNPLGERLKFLGDYFDGAIVGVVGDVRQRGLESDALPEMYISYLQKPMLWPTMNLVIRTTIDPAMLAASVRQAIQAVDPNQPIYNAQPMEQLVATSLAARRFSMLLLAAFAVLAVLLAAAGIYGVISFAVAERAREIGIRLALGAQARNVLQLVAVQGMKPILSGIALGVGAAYALTRLMKSLLFGVSATDPLTFAGVALLLLVVALLASLLPARRATKVDPLIALRHE
jgi:putative ABC transport system permease protein